MRASSWWRRPSAGTALLLAVWLNLGVGQNQPSAQPGGDKLKLRLAGYPRKHNEGRVEVFYKGQWGTICDDDFTLANAHVLCRQLGFVSATGWTHSAKYGKGTGQIWLDNVQCSGSEKGVEFCESRGWGNSDCTHDEDAGVVCKDERLPGFVDSNVIEMQVDENHFQEVRLRPVADGAPKRMPVTEGVVEVKFKDGWARVCGLGWGPKNARVVCGMMGFPSERKARNLHRTINKRAAKSKALIANSPHSRQKLNSKSKSKPSNTKIHKSAASKLASNIRIHSVACAGNEVHLSVCPMEFTKGNVSVACPGGVPAMVSCLAGPQFSHINGKKRKIKTPSKVRLKGGAKTGEGRVEVLRNNQWGTVCDDRWNLQAANVVCRELGFGSAKEALTGARLGQGIGPIHMSEVQCTGWEKSLWNCHFKNITLGDCKHSEDASVRCNVPYMAYEQTMRLTGGRSPTEGRVEVAAKTGNGTWVWGLVCGEGWGTREATVVCRQLGLGYAKSGLQETWYWETNNVTDMVLSGVKCTGNEMSLSHCRHHAVVNCQKAGSRFAAGVICSDTASDLVLNAPLVEQTVYIEDRPLHMLYCAAEENCLSKTAAKANWPYGHRRLLRFSSEIHNIGRADFRPKAGRHSWVWHECHRHYHSMDIFTHYDLLSVNGTKVADGHKASFCLEDTECQEGISKRYECANFGEQGITVACWDLYRHDIDCQWIDITDVKPGNYILQVIINPNYEVAESDFTNNAMKCNCKYDGHRIWLHKCHLGDAFSEEAEKRFEQYPGQLNNRIS
ncbi:lysyl oxidase homolog 3A-like isoform X1 [Scleropages formosus]|uniref:lysyl oxidase homolog 3A-like isoform X1 n=1 Tax=Scleropages formosus TaxID=113540 RepID=UPI0010FA7229|nr:lysyl oxidase homolog 3A-like isoform X1 [Scleropages formosus]